MKTSIQRWFMTWRWTWVMFPLVALLGEETLAQQAVSMIDVPELKKRIEAIQGDYGTNDGDIVAVSLRDATDEDVQIVKDLTTLRYLDIAHCKTNGSGLVNVSQLKNLDTLWLHNNTLCEKHLRHISCLPKLRVLWLNDTNLTDRGLRHLEKLDSLEKLYLEPKPVGQQSLNAPQ